MAEEELQSEAGDLEGAARHPALAQIKEVGTHLFLAELVRRAPKDSARCQTARRWRRVPALSPARVMAWIIC